MTEDKSRKILDEAEDRQEIDQWYAAAKQQTFATLPDFIKHVMDDYVHDYGTVVHAITACAVATAWACNEMEGARGGITGFQASFVMWGFVKHWEKENNKCGLKLLDYDDFLFPQYEYKFEKTIPPTYWAAIQKEARRLLDEKSFASPYVREHWLSIANGKLPFGFELETRK